MRRAHMGSIENWRFLTRTIGLLWDCTAPGTVTFSRFDRILTNSCPSFTACQDKLLHGRICRWVRTSLMRGMNLLIEWWFDRSSRHQFMVLWLLCKSFQTRLFFPIWIVWCHLKSLVVTTCRAYGEWSLKIIEDHSTNGNQLIVHFKFCTSRKLPKTMLKI